MPRGREIAEHELVALLGDRRRSGDIDDERNALLLGHLRDGGASDRSRRRRPEAARPRRSAFSARARATSTLDSVSAFMICSGGRPQVLENAGGDIDAALAVLADAGLEARARQQHADFERRALRAADVERRGAGDKARLRQAGTETCGG